MKKLLNIVVIIILTLIITQQAKATELINSTLYSDANLNSYWKLEDVNDTKSTNHFTNYNSVTFTSAKYNNGANLGTSNTNKRLTVANDIGIDGTTTTINAWVKLTSASTASDQTIADQRGGATGVGNRIFLSYSAPNFKINSNHYRNGVQDYIVSATSTLSTSSFTMITMTWDGLANKLYSNGVLLGSINGNGNGSGITDGFSLGSTANGYLFGDFLIDDVSVFSRALSATEILTLYNQGDINDTPTGTNTYNSTTNWRNSLHYFITRYQTIIITTIIGVLLIAIIRSIITILKGTKNWYNKL